jgi:outer membrane lipoprotein-sorting protein
MTTNAERSDRGLTRRALAGAMLVALALTPAAARSNEELRPEEEALIDRVNSYFNRFVYLQGTFTQIAPDGVVSEGLFYMRRPGRVRFDYKPPSRLLVVSDGFWIGIIDKKMQTTDRYPIATTPYWALLKDDVDLRRDARILAVELEPGIALLTIEDPSGDAPGEITLIFETKDDISLRQWLITDAQGLTTSVAINDVVENQRVRNDMFVIRDRRN